MERARLSSEDKVNQFILDAPDGKGENARDGSKNARAMPKASFLPCPGIIRESGALFF